MEFFKYFFEFDTIVITAYATIKIFESVALKSVFFGLSLGVILTFASFMFDVYTWDVLSDKFDGKSNK